MSGWSKGACPADDWGSGSVGDETEGASAATGWRKRSWAEAGDAEPMASPPAVTTAATTSEVINSFLLFKIRALESSHVNLIVSPSKMALTLVRLLCDPPVNGRVAVTNEYNF